MGPTQKRLQENRTYEKIIKEIKNHKTPEEPFIPTRLIQKFLDIKNGNLIYYHQKPCDSQSNYFKQTKLLINLFKLL